MDFVFEVADKSGRKIRLTNKQWTHIRKKHPEVEDIEMLKETIKNPDKINYISYDETIKYYFKYYKNRELSKRYLKIAVKYLNGEGYIVTAFFNKNIT